MQESREEAIKRLTESASSLEARTAQQESADLAAHKVTGEAYKIIADLIGGVLLGFALSIYMARRTANRLMAQAKAAGVTAKPIPFEEAGEDEDR